MDNAHKEYYLSLRPIEPGRELHLVLRDDYTHVFITNDKQVIVKNKIGNDWVITDKS